MYAVGEGGGNNLYRLTSVAFPGSRVVSYGYDDAGRRTSVTDWNLAAITYAYDDAGQDDDEDAPLGSGTTRLSANRGRD